MTANLTEAFDDLFDEMIRLDDAWTDDRELSGLRHAAADARHHLCHATFLLEQITSDPALLAPHAAHSLLDGGTAVLAHEAYMAVLALGQLLETAREERMASPAALDTASAAVWRMLEELAPFVSRADGALRRALLDKVPIDQLLEEMRSDVS